MRGAGRTVPQLLTLAGAAALGLIGAALGLLGGRRVSRRPLRVLITGAAGAALRLGRGGAERDAASARRTPPQPAALSGNQPRRVS